MYKPRVALVSSVFPNAIATLFLKISWESNLCYLKEYLRIKYLGTSVT